MMTIRDDLIGLIAGVCALCLLAGTAVAHTDEDDDLPEIAITDPAEAAVVAALEGFAAAFQATDIEAIHRLTLPEGPFSHFEGSFADWTWDSYAAHQAEEMPLFSETRYRLTEIRPEVSGDMAFATFEWAMDLVVQSDQFEGGRHPISTGGIGTAVLRKQGDDWKLRHLHTARINKAAAPE